MSNSFGLVRPDLGQNCFAKLIGTNDLRKGEFFFSILPILSLCNYNHVTSRKFYQPIKMIGTILVGQQTTICTKLFSNQANG